MKKIEKDNLTVLIPNATSRRNIGDLAMLQVLLDMVKANKKVKNIIVHSTDPHLHNLPLADDIRHTLYSWAIFEDKRVFVRVYRLSLLLISYFLIKVRLPCGFLNKDLSQLIQDFQNADLIIFVGGGYLRSKKGISQALNFLMQLFLFEFSRLFSCLKIVAPISFGPMGYKWQYRLSVLVLRHIDFVSAREIYSYEKLRHYGLQKVFLSSDHALLLKIPRKTKRNTFPNGNKFLLGFTVRNWLSVKEQLKFEKEYSSAISKFSRKTGCLVQPILQVDAQGYRIEDDKSATLRVVRQLRRTKTRILKIKSVGGIDSASRIYSSIDLLLGMRMHSNILAAASNTPFVAVSYEYKTEGIAKQLGMEKYCIKVEELNCQNLHELLWKAYKNLKKNRRIIGKRMGEIKRSEYKFWKNLFQGNKTKESLGVKLTGHDKARSITYRGFFQKAAFE